MTSPSEVADIQETAADNHESETSTREGVDGEHNAEVEEEEEEEGEKDESGRQHEDDDNDGGGGEEAKHAEENDEEETKEDSGEKSDADDDEELEKKPTAKKSTVDDDSDDEEFAGFGDEEISTNKAAAKKRAILSSDEEDEGGEKMRGGEGEEEEDEEKNEGGEEGEEEEEEEGGEGEDEVVEGINKKKKKKHHKRDHHHKHHHKKSSSSSSSHHKKHHHKKHRNGGEGEDEQEEESGAGVEAEEGDVDDAGEKADGESGEEAAAADDDVEDNEIQSAQQQEQQKREKSSDEDDETSSNEAPKKRRKEVSDLEIVLNKQKEENRKKNRRKKVDSEELNDMDNLISNFISEMKNVASEDRAANEKSQTAVQKLKMLPDVINLLQKSDYHATMIELGILGAIAEWLAPLPDRSLPNIKIREAFIDALKDFGEINADYLKSSGIGKAVMFLYKHSKETKPNKLKLEKLIHNWSRPIFNLDANFKQMSKEERMNRDLEHIKSSRRNSNDGNQSQSVDDLLNASDNSTLIRFKSSRKVRQSNDESDNSESDQPNKLLRPGDPGFCPRARVPMPSVKDYVIRPKSTAESMEMAEKKVKKSVSRLDKHKRHIAEIKRVSKFQRAVNMSVSGKF